MKTTTKANFARTCGVSRQAIDKQCKAGDLGLAMKGNREVINLDHLFTKDYLREKTTETPPPPPPKKKPAPKPKPDQLEITAPIASPREQPEITFSSVDDITKENFHLVTKTQIDIIAKYETALTTKQKREVDRRLYIERSFVAGVFSKLYSVDTNELKEMEDRLTPGICGAFKFDDDSDEALIVRKMLNDEITKSLRHIKRIMDEFLKAQKPKK